MTTAQSSEGSNPYPNGSPYSNRTEYISNRDLYFKVGDSTPESLKWVDFY